MSQQDERVTSCFKSDGVTGVSSTFVMRTDKDVHVPDLRTIDVSAREYKNPLIAPVLVEGLELNWWLDRFRDDKNRSEDVGRHEQSCGYAEEVPETDGNFR